jgi:hypothetical protein
MSPPLSLYQAVDQLAYFIRSSEAPIMPETFETVVHCGTLRCGSGGGGATEGLLRATRGACTPFNSLSRSPALQVAIRLLGEGRTGSGRAGYEGWFNARGWLPEEVAGTGLGAGA